MRCGALWARLSTPVGLTESRREVDGRSPSPPHAVHVRARRGTWRFPTGDRFGAASARRSCAGQVPTTGSWTG